MEAIYIPNLLKTAKRKAEIVVNDMITGLNTLTPVKGKISIGHRSNFLEVTSQVETITTLTCDRCLQHYNHRLEIDTSELIWLESEPQKIDYLATEREISWEDLSETLPHNGHFEPEVWLFEQLSLALPLRQVCGDNCPGAAKTSVEEQSSVDSRWASLAALKTELEASQD